MSVLNVVYRLDDLIVGAPNYWIDLSGATSSSRQVIPSAGKVYVYLQVQYSRTSNLILYISEEL